MTKRGWWKVKFEITLDGEDIRFSELSEVSREQIIKYIQDGCNQGEVVEESGHTDIIYGHAVDVYDNDGETTDRYTIVIDGDVENCISMSYNAQSFNMYVGRVEQDFLDTQKHLAVIPTYILKAVKARVNEVSQ